MSAPDSPTAPAHPGSPWGPTNPLTAYCCAERAAAAIDHAETSLAGGNGVEHERLLQTAGEWRQLAHALATNATMNRPRDDTNDRRR